MSGQEITTGAPWYRHFWPWFIVGLLGVSVVASVATVVIAFRNPDPVVGSGAVPDDRARPIERPSEVDPAGGGAPR